MIGPCRKRLLLLSLIALNIVFFSMPAFAAFPAEPQWIPVLEDDWTPITDPRGDSAVPHAWSDSINDPQAAVPGANYWWFDGTNMYFRMVLAGEPLVRNAAGAVISGPSTTEFYHVGLDYTGDNNYEWYVSFTIPQTLDNARVYTQYNLGADRATDGETGYTTALNPTAGQDWYVSGGYVYFAQDHARISRYFDPSTNSYIAYLEYWIPFTWLSPKAGNTLPLPAKKCDRVKMIYGTANHTQHICDDLVGSGVGQYDLEDYQALFEGSPFFSFCDVGYGVLRDVRTTTLADSGYWNAGETLYVFGYGWPNSLSAYYNGGNLSVKIVPPGGSLNDPVWTGTIRSDSEGSVDRTASWQIPIDAALGVYSIYVANPFSPAYYQFEDTFSVVEPYINLQTSTKTVDKSQATGGEVLTYTITVVNSGVSAIGANSITVQDAIPAYTTYVPNTTRAGGTLLTDVGGTSRLVEGYKIPVSLNGGSSYTITFQVRVNTDAPDQAIVNNVAQIIYAGTNTIKAVPTKVNQPVMEVRKTADPSSVTFPAIPNINYRVEVENIGHIALTNVVLRDNRVKDPVARDYGDTNGNGILDVGETWVYEYQDPFQSSNYTAGVLNEDEKYVWVNTATATCTQIPAGVSSTAEVEMVKWIITKSVSPSTISTPGYVTYTVQLRNLHTESEILAPSITDSLYGALPTAYVAPRLPDSPGDNDNRLEKGEVWNYRYTYYVTQEMIDIGSPVVNTVTAKSTNASKISASAAVTIVPGLSISKSGAWVDVDNDGMAEAGETINYAFSVTNTSTAAQNNVTVSDFKATVTGGPLPVLAAGATDSTTFRATYTITQQDIDRGWVENTAVADSNQSAPSYSNICRVNLPQVPMLSITKSGVLNDLDSNGITDAGETITYSFAIRNLGNVSLHDITVADPKAAVSGGPIASLGVGMADSTTFSGTYVVTQDDIELGYVLNTATADSEQTSAVSSNQCRVDIVQVTSFTIDKAVVSVGGAGPEYPVDTVGDVIEYKVLVTNTGNMKIVGTLSDSLPGISLIAGPSESFAPADGVLKPKETWTYTYSYTATQDDLDTLGGGDSHIDNTATFTTDAGVSQSDSASVLVLGYPLMIMSKQAYDTAGNLVTAALPGDILEYRITFENVGNASATAIIVTDILPLEITYVGGCASTIAGGTFTYQHEAAGPFDGSDASPVTAIMYTLPMMAPGAVCTISFRAQVK